MKKTLVVIIIALFWLNSAHSQDCSNIDYKKNKDEFIKCINKSEKKITDITDKDEDLSSKDKELELPSSSNLAVDWGCLNTCKQAVKGNFTISQLNRFCMLQCPMKGN